MSAWFSTSIFSRSFRVSTARVGSFATCTCNGISSRLPISRRLRAPDDEEFPEPWTPASLTISNGSVFGSIGREL